jgi:hypothetical protein
VPNTLKIILIVMACTLVGTALFILTVPTQAQGDGQNLLVDGGFEAPPTWPMQDGIGEVQVAPGWRAWYLDKPPAYVQRPVNCNDSPGYAYNCYWMRPEFRDNVAASFANRVHSGFRSQKYFSFGRMHEAGLYQQVGGIKPGTTLRFSIWIQAWQCFDINNCGKDGIRSDFPADMHLRVGIDPYGGTNPFSPNIVWSSEQEAFDRWVEFSVEAKALGDTVTVFTHSRPDWTWARMDNDVYLDDASLVAVEAPVFVVPVVPARVIRPRSRFVADPDTFTPGASLVARPASSATTALTTSTITASVTLTTVTQAASGTPAPGSQRTYVVVEGDTLTLIAQRFNTTVEAIMQANHITDPNLIFWGVTLIIP